MNEVSCRTFDPIFKACKMRGIPIEPLLKGLPYTSEHIEKASNRVDWDSYADFLNAFEEVFGGGNAILDLAASGDWIRLTTDFFAGPFFKWVLGSITSPRQLFWLSHRYIGPELFRNTVSDFEDLGSGKIKLRLRIPESARGCPAYFRLCGVNFQLMTLVIGRSKAHVEMSIGTHSAEYWITLPPSYTFWSRISRGLKWVLTGGKATFHELNLRLQELQEINRNLEALVRERTAKLTEAMQEQLAAERKLRESGLAVTAAVQAMFLPQGERTRPAALSVTGLYFPATVCGGDWWWHDELPDGRVRVLLGDVTGHGPGSAMVTAALASAYRILSRVPEYSNLEDVIRELNRNLLAVCQGRYFVTFGALEIDSASGVGHFWSAGAPPALVLSQRDAPRILQPLGTPLGVEEFAVSCESFSLGAGDRLLLFTDGLFDIPTGDERTYSLKDLCREMEKLSGEPTPAVVERMSALVEPARSREQGLSDDVTFVVCDAKGATAH